MPSAPFIQMSSLVVSPPARRAAPCVKLPGGVEPVRRTSGGQADGLLPERLPPQCEKMRPADEIYFSRQMRVICSAGDLSVTCAAARIPPRWKLRAFHNLLIRVLDDQKRLSSVPGCCIIYHYIYIYFFSKVRLDARVPLRDVFDLSAAPATSPLASLIRRG